MNKKTLLITSSMITLLLFNVKDVHGETVDSSNGTTQETEQIEIKSEDSTPNDSDEIMESQQPEERLEKTSKVTKEEKEVTSDSSSPAALLNSLSPESMYQEVIDAGTATEAWLAAQDFKENYPDHEDLESAFEAAGRRIYDMARTNDRKGNTAAAETYYSLLADEELLPEAIREEAQNYISGLYPSEDIVSPESMYQEVINARTATEAWLAAQDFKVSYPNHNKMYAAFEAAGLRIYNMGLANHRKGYFSTAITYYSMVVNEENAPEATRSLARTQLAVAKAGEKITSSKDMYEKTVNAKTATEAWLAAKEFKGIYPNDELLEGAFASAGSRIYNMGVSNHKNGKFNQAISYYSLLINEENISEATRSLANTQLEMAQAGEKIKSSKEMYQETVNAKTASEAWIAAQEFKEVYSNDSLLKDAFASAGSRIYNMGIANHKNGKFNQAISYYSMIINEKKVPETTRSSANTLLAMAQAGEKITSSKEMHKKTINAKSATEAWLAAQEFKDTYPNDTLLKDAFAAAGSRIYSMGVANHQKGNFNQALSYYSMIINENLVSKNLRDNAKKYSDMAAKGNKLYTASKYRQLSINAKSATESWLIATEGLELYPNDSKIIEALNLSANRNLKLGRSYQKQGNNSLSKQYFFKIINEPKVDTSIRTLATVFYNQTQSNHRPVVFLDAGHGGSDPGAQFGGKSEKKLTLDTSLLIKSELEKRGYQVILSRGSDVSVELIDRAVEANTNFADIFVSVHYNSMGGSGTATGIESFIYHRVASGFGQETNKDNFKTDDIRIDESLKLAESIHSNLISETTMYDRGVKGNNFSVLRNTYIPAVLLELGFMDNSSELNKISQKSYQQKAAKAVADGIDVYFKSVR